MRKTIAMLLALLLVAVMLPVTAMAAATGVSNETELRNAVEAGGEIKLTGDVTITERLTISKETTIDLNGKTLTSTWAMPANASGENRYAIVNKANLTIKNGKVNVGQARGIGAYAALTLNGVVVTQALTGGHACVAFCEKGATYTITDSTIDGAYAVACFADNATVNISNSKILGKGETLYHNGTQYGLKMTVSNTTIIGSGDGCGVYISGSKSAQANAENQNGVGGYQQAIFTNCRISGTNGVEIKYTDLILDNCVVEPTVTAPSYVQNNNGPASKGFAVVATDNAVNNTPPAPEGSITIRGNNGNYNGPVGLGTLESVKDDYPGFSDATTTVSGGTFVKDVTAYAGGKLVIMRETDNKYYVGDVAQSALENAVAGTSFDVCQAPNNTIDNVTPGVVLSNRTNQALTVNGKTYDATLESITAEAKTITIIVPSEGGGTATTPETTKNPGTGANDFVGAAVAVAVISAMGAAAVVRKK